MHVISYVDITTVIKQVGFTMKNRIAALFEHCVNV